MEYLTVCKGSARLMEGAGFNWNGKQSDGDRDDLEACCSRCGLSVYNTQRMGNAGGLQELDCGNAAMAVDGSTSRASSGGRRRRRSAGLTRDRAYLWVVSSLYTLAATAASPDYAQFHGYHPQKVLHPRRQKELDFGLAIRRGGGTSLLTSIGGPEPCLQYLTTPYRRTDDARPCRTS